MTHMKWLSKLLVLYLLLCGNATLLKAQSDITPVHLRVEYKINSYVDVAQPRFFYELESQINNQVQTARQIIVASSQTLLTESKADVWNSGKVSSDASIQILYGGPELQSNKAYFWKVRAWDAKGNAGPWSATAYWHTGLMKQSDWKANWIGYDVNHLSAHKSLHLPPASYLRKETTIASTVKRAQLYVTALGLYEFYINGNRIGKDYFAPGWTDYNKRVYYSAYDVTQQVKTGTNALAAVVTTGWYSGYLGYALLVGSSTHHSFYGKIPLLRAQLEIEYANGKKETIITDGSWKASTGGVREADMLHGETYNANLEPVNWKQAGFRGADWQNVLVNTEKMTFPYSSIRAIPYRW